MKTILKNIIAISIILFTISCDNEEELLDNNEISIIDDSYADDLTNIDKVVFEDGSTHSISDVLTKEELFIKYKNIQGGISFVNDQGEMILKTYSEDISKNKSKSDLAEYLNNDISAYLGQKSNKFFGMMVGFEHANLGGNFWGCYYKHGSNTSTSGYGRRVFHVSSFMNDRISSTLTFGQVEREAGYVRIQVREHIGRPGYYSNYIIDRYGGLQVYHEQYYIGDHLNDKASEVELTIFL